MRSTSEFYKPESFELFGQSLSVASQRVLHHTKAVGKLICGVSSSLWATARWWNSRALWTLSPAPWRFRNSFGTTTLLAERIEPHAGIDRVDRSRGVTATYLNVGHCLCAACSVLRSPRQDCRKPSGLGGGHENCSGFFNRATTAHPAVQNPDEFERRVEGMRKAGLPV